MIDVEISYSAEPGHGSPSERWLPTTDTDHKTSRSPSHGRNLPVQPIGLPDDEPMQRVREKS
jgi:hypothetical protein